MSINFEATVQDALKPEFGNALVTLKPSEPTPNVMWLGCTVAILIDMFDATKLAGLVPVLGIQSGKTGRFRADLKYFERDDLNTTPAGEEPKPVESFVGSGDDPYAAIIDLFKDIGAGRIVSATLNGDVAATHPLVPALIQTPLSQQLMPGEWLMTNVQLHPGSAWLRGTGQPREVVDAFRIMLNTGCDNMGTLNGTVPHQGYEQADSVTENLRLARFNASPFVYDIKLNGNNYGLDTTKHLIDVAGIQRGTTVMVHAVRAVSWDALDEYVRWEHEGRTNKAAG